MSATRPVTLISSLPGVISHAAYIGLNCSPVVHGRVENSYLTNSANGSLDGEYFSQDRMTVLAGLAAAGRIDDHGGAHAGHREDVRDQSRRHGQLLIPPDRRAGPAHGPVLHPVLPGGRHRADPARAGGRVRPGGGDRPAAGGDPAAAGGVLLRVDRAAAGPGHGRDSGAAAATGHASRGPAAAGAAGDAPQRERAHVQHQPHRRHPRPGAAGDQAGGGRAERVRRHCGAGHAGAGGAGPGADDRPVGPGHRGAPRAGRHPRPGRAGRGAARGDPRPRRRGAGRSGRDGDIAAGAGGAGAPVRPGPRDQCRRARPRRGHG